MRRSLVAVTASAILLLAAPALGASEEDRDHCNQTADPDLRIDGCTRVLEDRDEPQSNHATANNSPRNAWQTKRHLDRAIADYDQAIRLDPKNAASYSNRGSAWHKKNQLDRAIADYDQALRVDPAYTKAYQNRGVAWYYK